MARAHPYFNLWAVASKAALTEEEIKALRCQLLHAEHRVRQFHGKGLFSAGA